MRASKKLLTTLEDLVSPSYSAILVIDMQNDFCHKDGCFGKGGFDSRGYGLKPANLSFIEEMIPNLIHLMEIARLVGTKIYIVRTFSDDRYLPPMFRLRNLRMGRSGVICQKGRWGSKQFEGFDPQPTDTVITKHVYSAFIGTNLKDVLENSKIRSIIVTGVLTNVCCESTVREGGMHGFYVTAPCDCLASYNKEDHERSLAQIDLLHGMVTTSREIIRSWRE